MLKEHEQVVMLQAIARKHNVNAGDLISAIKINMTFFPIFNKALPILRALVEALEFISAEDDIKKN